MSDSLRDRIAAVLLPSANYCQQSMTRPCDDCMEYARKKADAVIRELDMGIPCATDGCRMRQIARRQYITEWTTDE
jgi:hypothetical protein